LPSCTLHINGRIVTRADGGPLDAEYALFESHEIELRSNNEPGTVREHGYTTTASLARDRLASDGVTRDLAESIADAMRPGLAAVYARGSAIRRVAAQLDACEMLEGSVYDPRGKVYEGAWLDVDALARESGVERAGAVLQALHLAALLAGMDDDARVQLTTSSYTKERRPGERTLRRVALDHAPRLLDAIRALGLKSPPLRTSEREMGPCLADLRAALRARMTDMPHAARERYAMIERTAPERAMPARGPLADPALWAIEVQLAAGDPTGALERLDAIERTHGRSPCIAYLRARVAFMMGSEEPRALAERVASLAESLSAFADLELLAAEAWARAGEPRRASAYARDVVASPQADDDVRERAGAIVFTCERAQLSSAAMRASAPVSSATMRASQARPSTQSPAATSTGAPPGRSLSGARPAYPSSGSHRADASRGVALEAERQGSTGADRRLTQDEPDAHDAVPSPAASEASRPPPPQDFFRPAPMTRPPARVHQVSAAQRMSEVNLPSDARPDTSSFLAATPLQTPPPRRAMSGSLPPTSRAPSAPAPTTPPPTLTPAGRHGVDEPPPRDSASRIPPASVPMPSTARSPSEPPPDSDREPSPFMKGASQPPFRTDAPPSDPESARGVPSQQVPVELAATLSLPTGLDADAREIDGLPHTIADARVLFTRLSRELGRDYKAQYGIELRTDLRSIEIMQRHLTERFPDDEITREDQALEIRRHGAFLSEILARNLGAEWIDVGLSEVGYWAMNVPPATRVWPFGRVLRFVAMGHNERDLVSYYLELERRQLKSRA
jgi:hypothetical protein